MSAARRVLRGKDAGLRSDRRMRQENSRRFDLHSAPLWGWKVPGISCDQCVCFPGNRHFEEGKIIPIRQGVLGEGHGRNAFTG